MKDRSATRKRGGYLLNRVALSMGRIFESFMRDAGLSDIGSGEGRLVYLLWKEGPIRQGELASKAGIDKSTMALTLARMGKKGLISRRPDDLDGRGVIVSISESAAARAAAFDSISDKMNALFYRGLSEQEIDSFEATLEKILANLES